MAGDCCGGCETSPTGTQDKAWHCALWMALIINGSMFMAEIAAGLSAHSASLRADALDFLADTANYAISLSVAGMALKWRARAALIKGLSLVLLACWVLGTTIWMMITHALPVAETMGVVGIAALIANITCALMLWRHREGDANRRSVWICSRNDAIGNLAVVAAAIGVFGTGSGWPDLAVAAVLSSLGLWGGSQIISHAREEMREVRLAN